MIIQSSVIADPIVKNILGRIAYLPDGQSPEEAISYTVVRTHDVDSPNAAFVHIHVEDLARAGQWFRTNEFREATRLAGVIRREFYLADKQERPATEPDE